MAEKEAKFSVPLNAPMATYTMFIEDWFDLRAEIYSVLLLTAADPNKPNQKRREEESYLAEISHRLIKLVQKAIKRN